MVSEAARLELISDGFGEIYYELAVLESDDWDEPLRLVNSLQEGFTITSQGAVFYAYPFRAIWPARDPGQPFGGARFEVNNVVAQDGTDEPVILYALRNIPTRARVRFLVVRASDPDTVEQQTTRLRLTGVAYMETTITGTLELPDFTGRRAGKRFTPDQYLHLRAG